MIQHGHEQKGSKLMQEVMISRNYWYEYILKQDGVLSFPVGFACNDNEIALLLQLPVPVRRYLREQKAMIVISPIPNMNDCWTYSIQSIPSEGRKESGMMARTYESFLAYIKEAQINMTVNDIELTSLRMTATDIFEALPDSLRHELEHVGRAPATVFSAIESSSA